MRSRRRQFAFLSLTLALACTSRAAMPVGDTASLDLVDTAGQDVVDTASLDVADTDTPVGFDCADACMEIPPGGTCGGCCTACNQGSSCFNGICECPIGGCKGDWDAPDAGNQQDCPAPNFDPNCGGCAMELAVWCGKNNTRCFCGEQSCGGGATVVFSSGSTCDPGTVCVGGGSGYASKGGECVPKCADECDPALPPTCEGKNVVYCTAEGACGAKVGKYACPSGPCVAGACQ